MQLAFLINARQNADQKPIGSAPAYWAQCTLPPQPVYQTLLFDFRGSGSETTLENIAETAEKYTSINFSNFSTMQLSFFNKYECVYSTTYVE